MKRVHLVVGVAGVVAFLLTGQYMDRALGHMVGVADLPRMLYRSAHIYLLLSSLLNVVLGTYLVEPPAGWRRIVSRIGSSLILIGPPLLILGFLAESSRTDFERPFAGTAIYACFAGVLLHGVARARSARTLHETGSTV